MSNDWYFVRDGARVGPRTRDEVAALLSTGVIPPETLVWSSGMENWRPASDLPEFPNLAPTDGSPPPVAPQPGIHHPPGGDVEPAVAADSEPRPWRRWAARLIDFGGFCLAFGVFIVLTAPGTITTANDVALNILMLALWVPVEAMVLSTFGTTPGKRLLGIQVANADGSQLGLGTALSRSFQVWVIGLGVGIPILTLFTMALGYNRLTREGATAWDRRLGLRVTYSEVSVVRWTVMATLLFLLIFFAVLGSLPAESL